jgi:hypothetical protein
MGNVFRAAVIVASASVFSMHADAEPLTLSEIRTRCSGPDGSEEFAFCRGYVAALVEGLVVKRHPDCIPPMVNDQQFALLMRKYLNANPGNLHLPAVDGVLRAITEMFKCETKGGNDRHGLMSRRKKILLTDVFVSGLQKRTVASLLSPRQ